VFFMDEAALFFYVMFVGGVAWYAHSRGRNPVVWGLVAAFISPLLAFIILVVMKDQQLVKQVNQLETRTDHLGQEVQHHQQLNQTHFQGVHQQLEQVRHDSRQALQQANRLQIQAQPPGVKARPCEHCHFSIQPGQACCPNCGDKTALPTSRSQSFQFPIICPLKTHISYIQELLLQADASGRIKEIEYLDMQTGGRLGSQQKKLIFVVTCWLPDAESEAATLQQVRQQLSAKVEQAGYQAGVENA